LPSVSFAVRAGEMVALLGANGDRDAEIGDATDNSLT
jgi:ABC-type Na+ transport system ATPase subunit NatA